jgi:hypothetical protein
MKSLLALCLCDWVLLLLLQAGSCNQEKGKDKTDSKGQKEKQYKTYLEVWIDW